MNDSVMYPILGDSICTRIMIFVTGEWKVLIPPPDGKLKMEMTELGLKIRDLVLPIKEKLLIHFVDLQPIEGKEGFYYHFVPFDTIQIETTK